MQFLLCLNEFQYSKLVIYSTVVHCIAASPEQAELPVFQHAWPTSNKN